ncbi:MAG: ferredoxin [Acidimicrobiia bacterium]
MRIRIDTDRCSGHGRCYDLAPDLFTDDEYGYGRVIADEVLPHQTAQAQTAVDCCPERAIELVDD